MAATFPKRRSDGSFQVAVLLRPEQPLDRAEVDGWLKRWYANESQWQREWTAAGVVVETETLRWDDAFKSPPLTDWLDDGRIALILEGTEAAPSWKDWMVRLVDAMRGAFGDLSVEQVVNVGGAEVAAPW